MQEALPGRRADNTARISFIRRQGGDGDVNLADVWPTITRVGARRAEPEPEEGWRGGTAKRHAGSTGWKHAGGCVRASAGSTAWTSAGSPAGMLDRPIVRVLGVHYDGGVSRYQA